MTVSEFLDQWVAGKRKKRNTIVSYKGHIENYLKPYLGHLPAVVVAVTNVRKAFDEIEAANEEIRAKRATQERRKPGRRKPEGYESRVPMGAASMQRLRATGRAAWNSELAAEIGITVNPFAALELGPGLPHGPCSGRLSGWSAGPRPKWSPAR
jgi:hypothetical protein